MFYLLVPNTANPSSTLMYFGIVTTGYAGSFFTPTILKQLGWTSIRAQVMSIPIFVTATVLALSAAMLSDHIKHRFGFIMAGCCVTTIGYSILLAMNSVPVGARYFAVFAVVGGGYIAQPITLGWVNNNLGGHYKRGVGAALQVGLGNIGGTVQSYVQILTVLNIRRYRCQQCFHQVPSARVSCRVRCLPRMRLDMCNLCMFARAIHVKGEQEA